MNIFRHLLFVVPFLGSCLSDNKTNPGKTNSVLNNQAVSEKVTDVSGCYRMVVKNDTAVLTFTVEGKDVSGNLKYNHFEKDDNEGFIRGTLNDSLLIANYTFQSEGKTSVRQVVFKILRDTLYQGYGEERLIRDTAFLRDVKLAVFDTKHPFVRDCY